MSLRGDIAQTPLAGVLTHIAHERSTGVLEVEGPLGRKVLEIQEGHINIVGDGSGAGFRLGDLLVARGKVSEIQLDDALKRQRDGHMRLGDVLCEMGYVTKGDIEKAVRFQIQEEICDLFTWREGTYTFDTSKGGSPGTGIGRNTMIRIRPEEVIPEATSRAPLWEEIESVIPSAHMVFRLTDRGRDLLDTASPASRRLLDLIDSGYDVLGIVQQTQVGRFHVSKALADLLKAKAIEPIPPEELPDLADALARNGKYVQAVACFRRLLEVEEDPERRRQWEDQIRILQETIEIRKQLTRSSGRNRRVTGLSREQIVENVRVERRRHFWRSLLIVLISGAAMVVSLWWISRALSAGNVPADVKRLVEDAHAVAQAGRYQESLSMLEQWLKDNPEADARSHIEQQMRIISGDWELDFLAGKRRFNDLLSGLPDQISHTARKEDLAEAEHLLQDIDSGHGSKPERAEWIRKSRRELAAAVRAVRGDDRLAGAQQALAEARMTAAREAAEALAADVDAAEDVRAQARDVIAEVGAHLGRVEEALQGAQEDIADGALGQARTHLAEALRQQRDGDVPERVAALRQRIQTREAEAVELLTRAQARVDSQRDKAVALLEQVVRELPGSKAATEAAPLLQKLSEEDAASLLAAAASFQQQEEYLPAAEAYLKLIDGWRFRELPAREEALEGLAGLIDLFPRWIRQAGVPGGDWHVDEGLEICRMVTESQALKDWPQQAVIPQHQSKLQRIRGRIKAMAEQPPKLQAQGRVGDAWQLVMELRERYPDAPAVRNMRMRIDIVSDPAGAEVWKGEHLLGLTPLPLEVGPFDEGRLELRKAGHQDVIIAYGNPPQPRLEVALPKGAAAMATLPSPAVVQPVLVGPVLVVPVRGFLLGINPHNGAEQWRASLEGGEVAGPMFVQDQDVFLATTSGLLARVRTTDGAVLLRMKLGRKISAGPVVAPLLGQDEMAYVVDKDRTIHQVWLARKKVVRRLKGESDRAPVLQGSTMIVANKDGVVRGIAMQSLRERWRKEAGGRLVGRPAGNGEQVAIITQRGLLQVVEARSGRTVMKRKQFVGQGRRAALLKDRLILAEPNALSSLMLDSGQETWRVSLSFAPAFAPVVVGETILLADGNGNVYAYRLRGGDKKWELPGDAPLASAPAAAAGRFAVSTQDGRLLFLSE